MLLLESYVMLLLTTYHCPRAPNRVSAYLLLCSGMSSLVERKARFAHEKIRNGFISIHLDLTFIFLLAGHFISSVLPEGPSSTDPSPRRGRGG